METIILSVHLVIVVTLIFVILIQRTGQDGLSGLGGGSGGGSNALFSVRGKANLLTRMTSILATLFIITSLSLAYIATHKQGDSIVDKISSTKAAPSDVKTEEPATPAAPQVPLAK